MEAGEVCAVTGLTTTVPGQGLGAQQESSVPVLEPVLNYRIYLPDEVNAVEMMEKLKQLEEEDPQLHILWNEQLQEIHAQMMQPGADRSPDAVDQRALWCCGCLWTGQHCI